MTIINFIKYLIKNFGSIFNIIKVFKKNQYVFYKNQKNA